ncbi:hypothetical protein ABI59_13445 [Acidobacteria bacterium Mor1]|nr:hypothetical protein ABI59_13445 [Acidobacteria bacterium Mor1]
MRKLILTATVVCVGLLVFGLTFAAELNERATDTPRTTLPIPIAEHSESAPKPENREVPSTCADGAVNCGSQQCSYRAVHMDTGKSQYHTESCQGSGPGACACPPWEPGDGWVVEFQSDCAYPNPPEPDEGPIPLPG